MGSRRRSQWKHRIGNQGQLGSQAVLPVTGTGRDVPLHAHDSDVLGSESRQGGPSLPVLGPDGLPHRPAVPHAPKLGHLTVDRQHHLLEVAPNGGQADGPGPGAGGHNHGPVAWAQLLVHLRQTVVTLSLVNNSGLYCIVVVPDLI